MDLRKKSKEMGLQRKYRSKKKGKDNSKVKSMPIKVMGIKKQARAGSLI